MNKFVIVLVMDVACPHNDTWLKTLVVQFIMQGSNLNKIISNNGYTLVITGFTRELDKNEALLKQMYCIIAHVFHAFSNWIKPVFFKLSNVISLYKSFL